MQQPHFGWEEFKGSLREKYYSERVRAVKCEEFLHLKQKGSSIQEYYSRYVELARFAHAIVPDEVSKARRFVRGLDWETQKAITPFQCQTLKEAYERVASHFQVYQHQK